MTPPFGFSVALSSISKDWSGSNSNLNLCMIFGNIILASTWNKMNCELMLTYDTPALRQTGSRNLTGQKPLVKLVTKYQICVVNSCWEKCDDKCAYMFNVYKNQLSRQTGSRNLTGPKTLPTIWHTYMKLGIKYQISAIDSCWEKCDEKYLGRTEGRTDGQR
jgi:hypothetical protein